LRFAIVPPTFLRVAGDGLASRQPVASQAQMAGGGDDRNPLKGFRRHQSSSCGASAKVLDLAILTIFYFQL